MIFPRTNTGNHLPEYDNSEFCLSYEDLPAYLKELIEIKNITYGNYLRTKKAEPKLLLIMLHRAVVSEVTEFRQKLWTRKNKPMYFVPESSESLVAYIEELQGNLMDHRRRFEITKDEIFLNRSKSTETAIKVLAGIQEKKSSENERDVSAWYSEVYNSFSNFMEQLSTQLV